MHQWPTMIRQPAVQPEEAEAHLASDPNHMLGLEGWWWYAPGKLLHWVRIYCMFIFRIVMVKITLVP